MEIKDIVKRVFYYVTVPKCACCRQILDFEDKALCKECLLQYRDEKLANCSVCSKPFDACVCSNEYLERHMVKRLFKVFRYHPENTYDEKLPTNELLYVIKRDKRYDVVDFLTDELMSVLDGRLSAKEFVITNVPRKRDRVRKYGFDHSRVLAGALAERLGIEYVDLLVSRSSKAQKKTRGEERILNAKFDYRKHTEDIKGKRVILFDDIVTTGASMGNSATLIKGLGAKEIVGVCLAISFNDKYKPFASVNRKK